MMRFQYFQGRDEQWYWHLRARNGRIVADGAEGYSTKSNVKRAIKTLRSNVRIFDRLVFFGYGDRAQWGTYKINLLKIKSARSNKSLHYWSMVAANGEVIADGSESYSTFSNLKRAVRRLPFAICFAWPGAREIFPTTGLKK